MRSGCFICLDGVDGAGKSTQSRLLAEWLRQQGYTVTTCRDPGDTPLGERIRSLLLDLELNMSEITECFLYMASRSALVDQVIRPALQRNEIVLSDRFLLSTVAYQGYAGGIPPETIWQLGRLCTGNTLPDWTFVFDLPLAVSMRRKHGQTLDRMESKGSLFFEQVRLGFLTETKQHPECMILIDADRSVDEVQAQLRQEVAGVLGQRTRP